MKVKKIILDANVLIEAVKTKKNIFAQLKQDFPGAEFIISKSVAGELQKISKGNGRTSVAARIAVQLMGKNSVKPKKTRSKGDDSLVELCDKNSILVTQDRALRIACRRQGFAASCVKEKRHLIFTK